MAQLVPTTIWRCRPEVVVALDTRFGEPVDAYVNGSQVWLRDDGPGGITLEWRLHPVPGYVRPKAVGTYEVFSSTALAIAQGRPALIPLDRLWDGLECFVAYDEEIEPAVLAGCATTALGIAPDAGGLVDHDAIGAAWEQSGGKSSVTDAVLQALLPR